MGRTLGILLIIGGIAVAIILAAVMFVFSTEVTTRSGAVLGFAIGFLVLVLPQLGLGVYFLWQGGQERQMMAEASKQRDLLNIVQTRGQIAISDLVIELRSSKEDVNHMLHELVGMGLFSGYVNWEEGMLYSRQASELRQLSKCQHCGGDLELAGKGVIRCPYCGTEYYLES